MIAAGREVVVEAQRKRWAKQKAAANAAKLAGSGCSDRVLQFRSRRDACLRRFDHLRTGLRYEGKRWNEGADREGKYPANLCALVPRTA
jgi:hypothetical protein